ncbi:hypothetical protein CBF34_02090 [Vagococcus penaei]|uniref:Cell division protein DivIB n=1 Tax=Vagococcus penaei TaxID=633807 RepID=A0A1Q2D7U7_9ENTE|nr:cell division protein FtsQ/DivIB [Vagococcus penaei]AQP54422.1 hypothetical protein BW732_09405 [Vagococcus penaei]RSU06339.1 hypothetical protein CBF34_02090 [Vagococcus penaei]
MDKKLKNNGDSELQNISETKEYADKSNLMKQKKIKDTDSVHKKVNQKLTWFLGILTLAVFINLYFISPLSKVQKVTFVGVNNGSESAILKESDIKIGSSIWPQYFKRNVLENNILSKDQRIKAVAINLSGLTSFQVSVEEYPTIGYLKEKDDYYEILANGIVLKQKASSAKKELPIFTNFEKNQALKEFVKAYNQFDQTTQKNISQVESLSNKKNPYKIKMTLRDGNQIIALSNTVASKMPFYSKIAKEMSNKGIIDMEAGANGIFSYPFEETKESEVNIDGFSNSNETTGQSGVNN